MDRGWRIFVAGQEGLVGSALLRRLREAGYVNLLSQEPGVPPAAAVKAARPDFVFLVSGRSGGILANQRFPADLMEDNLRVQLEVLQASRAAGVRRLLCLASACVYPRACPQPMKEEHLMTGPLEPTSEAYAMAKLAGLAQCRASNRQFGTRYLPAIPTNIYGPGDDFGPDSGHVCAALLARMHARKEAWVRGDLSPLVVWGTGSPKREFIYVDDLADACIFLMERDPEPEVINLAAGEAVSSRDLAFLVREVVGFPGEIVFDSSRPDGVPSKTLDGSRLKGMGWRARIPLSDGLRKTYSWYLSQQ